MHGIKRIATALKTLLTTGRSIVFVSVSWQRIAIESVETGAAVIVGCTFTDTPTRSRRDNARTIIDVYQKSPMDMYHRSDKDTLVHTDRKREPMDLVGLDENYLEAITSKGRLDDLFLR